MSIEAIIKGYKKESDKIKAIIRRYCELDAIWKFFPESYYEGFTIDWKNKFPQLLVSAFTRPRNIYYEVGCLINCSYSLYRRTNDPKVLRAAELITKLGCDFVEYEEMRPVCIKFSPTHYEDTVLELNKIKKQFFTDFAFGPYKKGCSNLANPNVHESARIEFGRYEKGGWKRTNISNATHIGVYFDGSYLSPNCIKQDGICKIFYRNMSSHRRQHIFNFIIRRKEGEYHLDSLSHLKEEIAKAGK